MNEYATFWSMYYLRVDQESKEAQVTLHIIQCYFSMDDHGSTYKSNMSILCLELTLCQ